jgi:hypothetical protein
MRHTSVLSLAFRRVRGEAGARHLRSRQTGE